jgi:hypothetical protein
MNYVKTAAFERGADCDRRQESSFHNVASTSLENCIKCAENVWAASGQDSVRKVRSVAS